MFSREQIERLEGIGQTKKHLATTYQSGFKRGSFLSEDNAVADIYEEAFPNDKIQRNFTCKTCNYNFYRKVAEKYFEAKEFYEKLDKKKAEEEKAGEEVVDMVLEMAGKKTPNKRKTAKKK